MGTGPRAAIPSPRRRPVDHSLLAASRTNQGATPALGATDALGRRFRWEGGFAFTPPNCGDGDVTDPCNADTQALFEFPAVEEWDPFLIRTGLQCLQGAQLTLDTIGADARELLDRQTAFRVEAEHWSGDQVVESGWANAYLTGPTSQVLNSGAAMPSSYALAELQAELAECLQGAPGVIHANRRFVTQWHVEGLLATQPGSALILDLYGNLIVAGSGYGTGAPRVDQIEQLDVSQLTEGTFTITAGGVATAAIAFDANLATLNAALAVAYGLGTGATDDGGGLFTITFGSASTQLRALTVTISDTDPDDVATITTITEGGSAVDATGDTGWAYATGVADIRLSDLDVVERLQELGSVVVEDDQAAAFVRRFAGVAWDPCCHFAVNVDRCQTCCTPG